MSAPIHSETEDSRQHRRRWIWLLLLIPFLGLLAVPLYNARLPELFGFPFFYWYQLLWVPITSLITWLVYRQVRHDD